MDWNLFGLVGGLAVWWWGMWLLSRAFKAAGREKRREWEEYHGKWRWN